MRFTRREESEGAIQQKLASPFDRTGEMLLAACSLRYANLL